MSKKKDCLDGDCSAFTLSKSGLVKQKPDKLDPLSYQYDYSLAGSDIVSEGMLIGLDTQKTCQGLHNTVDLYSPNKPNFSFLLCLDGCWSDYVWFLHPNGYSTNPTKTILLASGVLGLAYGGFEWYYFSGKFNYNSLAQRLWSFTPVHQRKV